MKCTNCGCDMTDTEISASFTKMQGKTEVIDVTIECPECEERHYTFIPVKELCTG